MKEHKAFASFPCWRQMGIPTLNISFITMMVISQRQNWSASCLLVCSVPNTKVSLLKFSIHSCQLSSTQCKHICSFTTESSLLLFFHSMLPTQGCLNATQHHVELESIDNEKSLFFLSSTSCYTCPINML